MKTYKDIYIELEDPSAKEKIFSFETHKFYTKLQYVRRLKLSKIKEKIDEQNR